jgi:phage terminase small subunit
MRGRRPKPTPLKVLTGNPGKRPLNKNEPRPDVLIPECPPELGPVARREWDRVVGDLAALRLLTNLDRAALAAYCGAYALWAEATEAIHGLGTTRETVVERIYRDVRAFRIYDGPSEIHRWALGRRIVKESR